MTSIQFFFCLTCLFLGKLAQKTHLTLSSSVHQTRRFISALIGDSVTLQCFYKGDDSAWLFWYIQTPGQKPKLMSTFYVYDTKVTFNGKFNNNPRFTLNTENHSHHLNILDLKFSDSATYYCAASYAAVLTFGEGATLSVKGSGTYIQASVLQSESQTIQPARSESLKCTVHTGTCDGEHSVYWFKNSEESYPGLIYTYGGSHDKCERNPNIQTHTCVYSLPVNNLNVSHAGTYYCAVASCGQILFGNGTKLDFTREEDHLLVYILAGALIFTTLLIVLLSFSVYKMNKRNSCRSTESRFSALPTTNAGGNNKDMDSLHYAALDVNQPNRSRKQQNNFTSECIYSSVRQ